MLNPSVMEDNTNFYGQVTKGELGKMSSIANFKVIRGGGVLDIANHRRDSANVLIDGNRIAEIMTHGRRQRRRCGA